MYFLIKITRNPDSPEFISHIDSENMNNMHSQNAICSDPKNAICLHPENAIYSHPENAICSGPENVINSDSELAITKNFFDSANPVERLSECGMIVNLNINNLATRNPDKYIIHELYITENYALFILEALCRDIKSVNEQLKVMSAIIESENRILNDNTSHKPIIKAITVRRINNRIQFEKARTYVRTSNAREALTRYLTTNNLSNCNLNTIKPTKENINCLTLTNLKVINLEIQGLSMCAFGNLLLLRDPFMREVRVRSFWKSEEFEFYKDNCLKEHTVLISPFISAKEKYIMREGIKMGKSIIHIIMNDLSQGWRASEEELQLCREGRLLILSERGRSSRGDRMSRDAAMRMNKIAEGIARNSNLSMKIIKK